VLSLAGLIIVTAGLAIPIASDVPIEKLMATQAKRMVSGTVAQ